MVLDWGDLIVLTNNKGVYQDMMNGTKSKPWPLNSFCDCSTADGVGVGGMRTIWLKMKLVITKRIRIQNIFASCESSEGCPRELQMQLGMSVLRVSSKLLVLSDPMRL